jgi:hypothetical protein
MFSVISFIIIYFYTELMNTEDNAVHKIIKNVF